MNKALFSYFGITRSLMRSDNLRRIEPPNEDPSFRFDTDAPDNDVSDPAGFTTYFGMHGVPVRAYNDGTVTRFGNVSPYIPYFIQKGRRVARGRITTLEATPATPARDGKPILRGNGTL